MPSDAPGDEILRRFAPQNDTLVELFHHHSLAPGGSEALQTKRAEETFQLAESFMG